MPCGQCRACREGRDDLCAPFFELNRLKGVLYDGETFTEFRAPKLGERYISGAGCTLAAAITAELAKGAEVTEAVRVAKAMVTHAIEHRATPHTPFDEAYQGGFETSRA